MLYDIKLVGFNTDEILMIDLCMKVLNYDASRAYDCIDNMPSVIVSGANMDKVKEIKAAFESEGALIEVVPQGRDGEGNTSVVNDDVQKRSEYRVDKTPTLNETDLEILNLKYNPYENNKNSDSLLGNSASNSMEGFSFSGDLEEKRSRKHGRRSTDVDPKSVNYGRRSTDSNPMIYKEINESKSILNQGFDANYNTFANSNMQSSYPNDIGRIKSITPLDDNFGMNNVSRNSLDNDELSNNDNTIGNTIIEKKSPYGGMSKNKTTTGNQTLRKDSDETGYKRLNKNNQVGYSKLRKDTNHSEYQGLRKDSSQTGYGGLRKDTSYTGYGGVPNANNMPGYGSLGNTRDALDNTQGKPPYAERLSKSKLYDVNEINKPQVEQIIPNNNVNPINSMDNKDNEVKTPYENSTMNFTKQQHFGTIDKEKKEDDLYDLSGIRREKKVNQNKYQKEHIICPKCGSAFVLKKRAQGLFGPGKVKHICEACKFKF